MTTTHATIADQLTAAGHDPTTLTGDGLKPQTAMPVTVRGVDDTLISGIAFSPDFETEQELGIGELRESVTGTNRRNFKMTDVAARRVAMFTDVPALALSTETVTTRTPAWGDVLNESGRDRYADDYEIKMGYAQGVDGRTRLGWATVSELRAHARQLGIRPLPRLRADLKTAVENHPDFDTVVNKPRDPDVWPAAFTFGRTLVVRADDGAGRVVVEGLVDAVTAGTLAVGSYSGMFSSGLFLYDSRDETDTIVARRELEFDQYDARMADLVPVLKQLTELGHQWYFLGHPRAVVDGDGEQVVRYWLNGSSGYRTKAGRHVSKQPAGWFTIDELLAEAFLPADR